MAACVIGVTWLLSPPNETSTCNYDLHGLRLSLFLSPTVFFYHLHNSLHTRDKCAYSNLKILNFNLFMQSTHLVPP